MRNTSFLLLLIFFWTSTKLLSQSPQQSVSDHRYVITGIVKDASSGESLPFASLQIPGSPYGTHANVDGWFTLYHTLPDTVTIRVDYIGYSSALIYHHPSAESEELIIKLNPSGLVLDEVQVEAHKKEQMMQASTGISRITISPAHIEALPSLGEKDIFRSMQLLPGVGGSNESSSGLYVRGGTPDQNLVLFDGFTVYHVDHLFGFFSAFNSRAIKDVQLYKGGFEAKYGGRLSSVVDITGKDGNTERFDVGAGLSLLSANASAELPFANGKGSLLVTARRSFQSSFYNQLLEFSDGDDQTTTEDESNDPSEQPFGGRRGFATAEPDSWFYDLNAKATYRTRKDVFSLSLYNGKDELDNSRSTDQNSFRGGPFGGGGGETDLAFTMDILDQSEWGNTGGSLKWSRRWNESLYSNALISGSQYFSYRDRGIHTVIERDTIRNEINAGTVEDNDLRDFSLRWDWEWKPNPFHTMSYGAFGTALDIAYDFVQNDTTPILSRDDQGFLLGGYLQSQSILFEKLILTPGLRATHFDQTQKLYLEPRFQLQYLPNQHIKLKAAIGRYYQFANRIIREDISQGSRDFWILSDVQSVPVGKADHLILGLSVETDDYLFDVEAYHKDLEDITEYSTRFVLNGFGRNTSLDFEENFFQGNGTARGVELLAQKKSGKLTGWISYTLSKVNYSFDVYGEDPFPASHDVPHELKIVALYRHGNWSFGSTFIYATGKPYTAPLGAYTVDLLDGNSTDHFAVSNKNALRLADYHRLDCSVNYHFPSFLGGNATAGLSLFNLYDRNNIWYKEYEVVDGTILETDVNLLGLTPSIHFNWNLR
ncbi:MAG: TonB-dependent receptor [Bacteroidota bacterium]